MFETWTDRDYYETKNKFLGVMEKLDNLNQEGENREYEQRYR